LAMAASAAERTEKMAKGYIWNSGDTSVKGEFEVNSTLVHTFKKHSAKGQWGENKDKSAPVLNVDVETKDVPDSELRAGYTEWWIINRFRRHSGILDTDRQKAIELWDGKVLDPTVDCLPPEDGKRGPVDPVKVTTKLVKKMTAEEKAALIALLQAE